MVGLTAWMAWQQMGGRPYAHAVLASGQTACGEDSRGGTVNPDAMVPCRACLRNLRRMARRGNAEARQLAVVAEPERASASIGASLAPSDVLPGMHQCPVCGEVQASEEGEACPICR